MERKKCMLADTLDYLHHTLAKLEAHAPSWETGVDANLTEQNDYSKMVDLKTYFDTLPNKPFSLTSSDQTSFIAKFHVVKDGQHTDDILITIHHASVGLTRGYTVEYTFFGWRSKTYRDLDARTLFSKITSKCKSLVIEMDTYWNSI